MPLDSKLQRIDGRVVRRGTYAIAGFRRREDDWTSGRVDEWTRGRVSVRLSVSLCCLLEQNAPHAPVWIPGADRQCILTIPLHPLLPLFQPMSPHGCLENDMPRLSLSECVRPPRRSALQSERRDRHHACILCTYNLTVSWDRIVHWMSTNPRPLRWDKKVSAQDQQRQSFRH